MNYRAELVGVLGDPVDENPTILTFENAFKAKGLNFRYLTILVHPEDLEAAMKGVRAFNMRGIHLTMPHKVTVIQYLDELSKPAEIMGAVNTVVRRGDKLVGENTDGKGFMRALTFDAKFDPKGKKMVIFGAGGAARAISVELALAGLKDVLVVNRGKERGMGLVDTLNSKTDATASYAPWTPDFRVPADADVVVNATSIGMDKKSKPVFDYSSLSAKMTVCDAVHLPTTPFLEEAKKQGSLTLDGLGMLAYQGAVSFKLWTGEDAPVEVMIDALKKAFA